MPPINRTGSHAPSPQFRPRQNQTEPAGYRGGSIDELLLEMMVHKVEASEDMLRTRIDKAKAISADNQVLRRISTELEALLSKYPDDVWNQASRNNVRIPIPAAHPRFEKLRRDGVLNAGSAPIGQLLTALNYPSWDAKVTVKQIASDMSQTESQEAQILLQDALQKSKEAMTTAGGLLKARNDACLTVWNKI